MRELWIRKISQVHIHGVLGNPKDLRNLYNGVFDMKDTFVVKNMDDLFVFIRWMNGAVMHHLTFGFRNGNGYGIR